MRRQSTRLRGRATALLAAALALGGVSVSALATAAQAEDGLDELGGRWTAEPGDGAVHTFVFDGEGGLDWTIAPRDRAPQFYPLIYKLNGDALDIFGFVSGELKGRALYGRVSSPDAHTMLVDLETASLGQDEARPATLDVGEAWRLTRVD